MNRQQILALKPPRRPGFANFVAGPNQALVDTLASGLESGGWYLLAGPSGSGRSHLLAAAFSHQHRRGQAASFIALSVRANRQLLDQAGGDWVIVDDIDVLAADSEGEMQLFNALNRWRAEHTGVIMSGVGREPFELPDLRSRLGQATRLTLKPLDEADLKRLIEQVAGEHEVILGRGAADYLLSRTARNPARIARLIETLALRALSERRTLSVPLIRETIK